VLSVVKNLFALFATWREIMPRAKTQRTPKEAMKPRTWLPGFLISK